MADRRKAVALSGDDRVWLLPIFCLIFIRDVFSWSCKENLLRTAYMDGMVRASLSERCEQEVADLGKCTQYFFNERQAQQGLQEFLVKVRAWLQLILHSMIFLPLSRICAPSELNFLYIMFYQSLSNSLSLISLWKYDMDMWSNWV